MTASNVIHTKEKPYLRSILGGYVIYGRYRDGTEMKNRISFVPNPKASEADRIRHAHTLTTSYEHINGLVKLMEKKGLVIEQLERVPNGNTYVNPVTNITWADRMLDGYVIPARVVSDMVDEANRNITERAHDLSRGDGPAPDASAQPA